MCNAVETFMFRNVHTAEAKFKTERRVSSFVFINELTSRSSLPGGRPVFDEPSTPLVRAGTVSASVGNFSVKPLRAV